MYVYLWSIAINLYWTWTCIELELTASRVFRPMINFVEASSQPVQGSLPSYLQPVGSRQWCVISLELQTHYQISLVVMPQHARSPTVKYAHSSTKRRNLWCEPLLSRRCCKARTSFPSPAVQPGCPSNQTARTYAIHMPTSVNGLGRPKGWLI